MSVGEHPALAEQVGRRDGAAPGERMVGPGNDRCLVAVQDPMGQVGIRRGTRDRREGELDLPALHHRHQGLVEPVEDGDADLRMTPGEDRERFRQQARCLGRPATHHHAHAAGAAQPRDFFGHAANLRLDHMAAGDHRLPETGRAHAKPWW